MAKDAKPPIKPVAAAPTAPRPRPGASPTPAGVPRLSIEARATADLEAARARAKAQAQATKEEKRVAAGGGWQALPIDQKCRIAAVGAAVLILILGLAFGSTPTKIVVAVMCLGMLQGLWRGASELVGLVVASIFAVLLAPPLGRGLEGLTAGLFGTSGILNRMISVLSVGLIVVIVGTAVLSIVVKKLLKNRPELLKWNSVAGGGLGLVEGTILGMAILWVGLALEPVAASQVADSTSSYVEPDADSAPSPLAKGVKAFADNVRDSALGGLAQATNPIEGSRLLTLANDFAMISRDEVALEHLLSTPVMKEIEELPSVVQARERINADTELTGMLTDHGVSTDTLRAIMESKTILEIFDNTSVVSDLTPKADALFAAIAEAKAKVGSGVPMPPTKVKGLQPPDDR